MSKFRTRTRTLHWSFVAVLCYYCILIFDWSFVDNLYLNYTTSVTDKPDKFSSVGDLLLDHTSLYRLHEFGLTSDEHANHKRIYFMSARCVELYKPAYEMYLQHHLIALLRDGNALTVVCAGGASVDQSEIRKKFKAFGELTVSVLSPSQINKIPKYGGIELKTSSALLDHLIEEHSKKKIEIMIFHDFGGIGTAPIQAKRSGMAFDGVVMVTICLRPTRTEQSFQPTKLNRNNYITVAMEDYTRNFADFTTYPTKYQYDEMQRTSEYAHTNVPVKSVLLPMFHMDGPWNGSSKGRNMKMVPKNTFCVFSHLHLAKAFQNISIVFSELLDQNTQFGTNIKLVIIDVEMERSYQSAFDYFVEKLGTRMSVSRIHKLTMENAAKSIFTSEMVVLLPDSIYSRVQELHILLYNDVHTIYADGEGLDELSKNRNTFYDGSIVELKGKVLQSIGTGIGIEPLSVSSEISVKGFVSLVHSVPAPIKITENWAECEDVTFAIVTVDRVIEVTRLLRHLKNQSCTGFSVVLYYNIDCGNTCQSRALDFEKMTNELGRAGITMEIIFPRNGREVYITTARNDIIQTIQSKYLILFDDDDVPHPDFISVLRRAAVLEDADAVSSYCLNVDRQSDVDEDWPEVQRISLSAGNTGSVGNFFLHYSGKANLLLRTSFVREIGGCIPENLHLDSPFVDWGLYTNIILNKGRIAIVPFGMYFYQLQSKGSIYYGSEGNNEKIYHAHLKMTKFYCAHFEVDNTICELIWRLRQQLALPSIY